MTEPKDHKPFPVQRSLLSAAALAARVLPAYRLPTPVACHFWHRSINDTYLVQAASDRYMLRVSPASWRPRQHLQSEIELLRDLTRDGLTVPQPIPQQDGAYIQGLHAPEGQRYALLFSFVPGSPPGEIDGRVCRRYGQALARLHTVSDGYPGGRAAPRYDPAAMLDEPLERLRPLFAGHPDDLAFLLEIAPDLKAATRELPLRAPEYGVCHGDINLSNLHFDGQGGWALLDFEYFGYGWRIFDVATFYNNLLFELGVTPRAREGLEAFLEGYQSLRSLSQAELAALPAFVILRQVWLLGVGARNLPHIGLRTFQAWLFERCMPLIRAWVQSDAYAPG